MKIQVEREFRNWWSRVTLPPFDELNRKTVYYDALREIAGKAWRASARNEKTRKEEE